MMLRSCAYPMKNTSAKSWFLLAATVALGCVAVSAVTVLPYAVPTERPGVTAVTLNHNPAPIVGAAIVGVSLVFLVACLFMGTRRTCVPGQGPRARAFAVVVTLYALVVALSAGLFARCDLCEKSCFRHKAVVAPEGWTTILAGTGLSYSGPAEARICSTCQAMLNPHLDAKIDTIVNELKEHVQQPHPATTQETAPNAVR